MQRSDEENDVPWYKEWFDRKEYELVYEDRDAEEAAQLVDLIDREIQPAPGDSILDVGCGRGRHAIRFAQKGYRVTGLDLSERALKVARQRARDDDLDVTFIQADMREPFGVADFDGAVNLFTSFGYFEDDDDHEKVICNISRALKTGGWLVKDFMNVPYVRENLVARDRRTENATEIIQRRWFEDDRLNKEIQVTQDGETHTFLESVRLFTLEDFKRMYDSANLELIQTFGNYQGAPYHEKSPRLILVARKRK